MTFIVALVLFGIISVTFAVANSTNQKPDIWLYLLVFLGLVVITSGVATKITGGELYTLSLWIFASSTVVSMLTAVPVLWKFVYRASWFHSGPTKQDLEDLAKDLREEELRITILRDEALKLRDRASQEKLDALAIQQRIETDLRYAVDAVKKADRQLQEKFYKVAYIMLMRQNRMTPKPLDQVNTAQEVERMDPPVYRMIQDPLSELPIVEFYIEK
jgi:hypothetical protein